MPTRDFPVYQVDKLTEAAKKDIRPGESLYRAMMRLRSLQLEDWYMSGRKQEKVKKVVEEEVPTEALSEIHARLDQLFEKVEEIREEVMEAVEEMLGKVDDVLGVLDQVYPPVDADAPEAEDQEEEK